MTTKTTTSFNFPLSSYLTKGHSESFGHQLSKLITLAAISEFLSKGQLVVIVGNELRDLIRDDLTRKPSVAPQLADSALKHYFYDYLNYTEEVKWNDIIQNYTKVTNSLMESFRLITACDSQQKGWTQIMLEYQSLVLQNSTALLEFEMMSVEQHGDLPNLTTLLNVVSEAKELYEPRFILLETTNPFNESVFIKDDKHLGLSVLLKYINNYIVKGELLSQRFVEFFSKVRLRMGLERAQLIDNTLRKLYKLKVSSESLNDKFNIFTELIESSRLAQLDLGFSNKESNNLNKSNFEFLLLQYINRLEKYSKSPLSSNLEYLKSINTRNYEDSELVKIEQDLAEWVKSIEDSQLFKKTIENNASSSLKKYQGLLDIANFLKIAQKRAEEMDNFYTWKTFTSKLTKYQKKLIGALEISTSGNWIELVKTWYYKECLRRVTRYSTQNPGSEFLNYIRLSEFITSNYPEIIASFIRDQQFNKSSSNDLTTVERELYTSQTRKGISFKEEEANKPLVFSLNIPEQLAENTVYLTSSKQLLNDTRTSVFHIDIKNEANLRDLIHASQIQNEISQEALDQKLSLARMLAKSLLETSEQINCYLTQSSNIILDCHAEVQNMIIDQWKNERLKSIRLGNDQNNALIEFLLNDSTKGFYIYDYIYSDNQLNLYKQAQKVKAMENAGFRTIYFDPISMANDQEYSSQFHKILKEDN